MISLENKTLNKTQIESSYAIKQDQSSKSTLKSLGNQKKPKNKPKIEIAKTTVKTEESKNYHEKTIEKEVEPIVTQQSDEEIVVEESHQSFIEIDEVTDESDCDQSYVSTPSKVEYLEEDLWQGVSRNLTAQDTQSSVEFSVIGDYPITPKPMRAPDSFAPCFKKSLTAQSCFESEAAEFSCQVEGMGLVRWTVNQEEVRPAQVGYSILVDDVNGVHTLIIERPNRKEHNGCNVKCWVCNTHGSASCEATLRVEKRKSYWQQRSSSSDRPPSVLRPVESPTPNDKDVQLECVMSGSSSVDWMKNGKSLNPKLFRKSSWKTEDSDTRTRLEVKRGGGAEMSGVYTCVGRDEFGSEVASSSTHVFFDREEDSSRKPETKDNEDDDYLLEAPIFTKELSAAEVKHGDKVRLKCLLKHANSKNITWFKDGKELSEKVGIKIGNSPTKPYLEIKKVKHSDFGEYSVTAANECGEVTCSAFLRVIGR